MTLNCLIVDDDAFSRQVLQKLVEKTDFLELAGSTSTAMEAANLLEKNPVHLIFLDIEMPEMTGIDLIKSLKEKPQIILVSGNKEYAIEAFEYDVTDYLLKPVNQQRFLKAVYRAKENLEKKTSSSSLSSAQEDEKGIFIKEGSQLTRLSKNDILYVEAYGDYVNIFTEKSKFTIHSTMKNIDRKLSQPEGRFMRVHRSYIVQLDKIDSIDESMIFINKKLIPIGGSFREQLMKKLNLF